jgi:hypothetical protein
MPQGETFIHIAFKVAVLMRRLPLTALDEQRCTSRLTHLMLNCWQTDPLRRPAAAEVVKELALVQMGL